MKVPLKWLADHVDLSGVELPELVERLTIAGLEVSGVRLFGLPAPAGLKAKQTETGPVWEQDKIVTARILGIDKHPNADKLKLVKLEYGAAEPKTVVTGAPNITVGESGQKVVLGLRGSVYFMEEEDKATKQTRKVFKTLEPKELRGIPNDAMCMSNFELGINDEHEGIILLEEDAPIGKPLADFMGDAVVEIDVLPNMARCLSMIGVAREVAAIFGKQTCIPKLEPKTVAEKIDGQAKVVITDPAKCARYSATIIKNVTIGSSPGWMQRRLAYAGMRPISNAVDVTNYVMLEWGQPLHAFDYDVLVKRAGGVPTITVRPATAGEVFKTLDGVERTLTIDDLVIADSVGVIALAGVMGGLDTEVTAATKNILLESASFDFVSVRKTAHKFTLFSEASTRFSRGVHPELVLPAAKHAAQLLAETAGGQILTGLVDVYPAPIPTQTILLKKTEIRRLLGIEFPAADVEKVLQALQFTVTPSADGWAVTVPPTRLDIQAGAADLIEELARIYGYDRLPGTLLSGELPPQRNNRELALEQFTRDTLANAGLQECICYSLTSKERETTLGLAGEGVELLNPISPERAVMRRTLLANLLEVAAHNLKQTDTIKLFELGAVFLPKPGDRLPTEPRRLALILSGRRKPESWDDTLGQKPAMMDFFDLKGVVEHLAKELHVPGVTFKATKETVWLHPGRSAQLVVGEKVLGVFGELHPKTASAFGLGERTILAGELDLEAILASIPERFAYAPVPQSPAALRDIAVVVDEAVTHEAVSKEIKAAGGDLLTNIRLFDVYKGDSIAAGKKSLAYALTYQSDKTLTDKEIDKAHKKIEDRLKHVLKGAIRGKE
ncbi:phenylalanine--tRNA ligase subunit beta [Zavarzinella formosa]|uniref:phenylalanine--tRNA ligase subunit beta n=1 Tax=Zavarzinella formosa TaxID=360055 RepID=UPI0002D2B663|nr:phenylalanine--tRNA ligase subunit beta [Zavarzinella formosa]